MAEDVARRGSYPRLLERSFSYSEAIGNVASERSSFELPVINNTEIYTNEEFKKQYRRSQAYAEGREVNFDIQPNSDLESSDEFSEHYDYVRSVEDFNGIQMKIDADNTNTYSPSDTVHISEASTQVVFSSLPTETIYETIDVDENVDDIYAIPESSTPTAGYSTPYTRRKRERIHKRRLGRPRRSRRVVFKDGEENVPVRSHITGKSVKYLRDYVNTVINSKWRFVLLFMVVIHFAFWLLFGGVWYVLTKSYGDDIGDGLDHCVVGTSSFAGFLMMAVETQMTIGYGSRYPSEECPEAMVIMVVEIVAGTALSGGLASLLFAKLVRPNRHVSKVGFSKKATVCLRDGQLCLQFRVWDLLNGHLIGSNITAYMMKPIRTLEGEFVQNYIHQLKLKQARAFLLWPITVYHVIDTESPLYDLSAVNMMDYRFEIVVCLTGSSKNMGTMTQSRTSYLSKEIIWGYRFKNVLNYSTKDEAYIIDMDNLNTVEQVETPLCSAVHLREFEERRAKKQVKTPDTSLSRDSLILSKGDSVSSPYDSTVSSPSFNRHGTQRSFGWHYRKVYEAAHDIHQIREREETDVVY